MTEALAGLGTAGEPAGLALGDTADTGALHAAAGWGRLAGMPLLGGVWAVNGDSRGGSEASAKSTHTPPFPGVISVCRDTSVSLSPA